MDPTNRSNSGLSVVLNSKRMFTEIVKNTVAESVEGEGRQFFGEIQTTKEESTCTDDPFHGDTSKVDVASAVMSTQPKREPKTVNIQWPD